MTAMALAEWAAVCSGLSRGLFALSVRKGGIHERGGGVFTPEHSRFYLLPTYEHQHAERLRPAYAGLVAPPRAGTHHHVPGFAEVVGTWRATDLNRLLSLGPALPFSDAEIAARFAYRDQPFLYVLALRVMPLTPALTIADHPSYAGCRSWITLHHVEAPEPAAVAADQTAMAANKLTALVAQCHELFPPTVQAQITQP